MLPKLVGSVDTAVSPRCGRIGCNAFVRSASGDELDAYGSRTNARPGRVNRNTLSVNAGGSADVASAIVRDSCAQQTDAGQDDNGRRDRERKSNKSALDSESRTSREGRRKGVDRG